jgi:hypothetical protein
MKNLIIACLFCVLTIPSQAQDRPLNKVRIVLNNKAVVEGYCRIPPTGKFLTVLLAANDSINIRWELIKRLRMSGVSDKNAAQFSEQLRPYFRPLEAGTLYHELKGGLMFGDDVYPALHTINGYMLHSQLGVGVGLGMEQYYAVNTAPLYAQVRGYIKNKKVAPYVFADGGYGFAWSRDVLGGQQGDLDTEGGLYWQAGVGYEIHFRSWALITNIGYKQQRVVERWTWQGGWGANFTEVEEKTLIRRVLVSVGFKF